MIWKISKWSSIEWMLKDSTTVLNITVVLMRLRMKNFMNCKQYLESAKQLEDYINLKVEEIQDNIDDIENI